MIYPLVEQVIRPVIESLEWVDLFGGIALDTYKVVNDEGLEIIFPVSTHKSVNCPPSEQPILAPDSKRMSILWCVETSPATSTVDARYARRSGVTYSQNLRLLGWLNGPALGERGFDFHYTPANDVVRILNGLRMNNFQLTNIGVTDDLPINRMRVQQAQIAQKDHRTLFAPATYASDAKWFTDPYDYFAIDFTVEWTVVTDCMPAYQANDPSACPPGYIPGDCGPVVSACEGNLIQAGEDGGACLTVNDLPDLGRNGIFDVANENGGIAVKNVLQRATSEFNEASTYWGSDHAYGQAFFGLVTNGTVDPEAKVYNLGGLLRSYAGSFGYGMRVALINDLFEDAPVLAVMERDTPNSQPGAAFYGNLTGYHNFGGYGTGTKLGTVSYTLGVTLDGDIAEVSPNDAMNLNGLFSPQNEGATAQVELIQGHNPGTHYNGAFGASFLFGGTYIQGSGRQQGGELRQADGVQGASIWVWQEFVADAENANLLIQSKDTPSIESYRFNVKGLGAKWNDYGDGNLLDDTAPYALGVKADGQIVELTKGSGGGSDGNGLWTASNEPDPIAVNEILHNEQILNFVGNNAQAGKVTKFTKNGSGFSVFQVESFSDGTNSSEFRMTRGGGTREVPTALTSGMSVGRVTAWDAFQNAGLSTFQWYTGANWVSGSNHHMRYVFQNCIDSTTREDVFEVDGSDILFNQYGLGAKTGTVAYGLAVDASGKVIEVATGGSGNGIFDAVNEGGTVAVSNVTLSGLLNFNAQAFDGLRVSRDGGSTTIQVSVASDSNVNHSPVFAGYNSRGTVDSPTAVEVGRRVFAFNAFEHNGSAFLGNNLEFWKDDSSTQHTQLRLGLVYNGSANQRVLTISGNNGVEFNRYGSGAYTGTAAYGLAVDSSGRVIEVATGGGGGNGIFDASNEGGTTAVGNVLLSTQFRFYRETGGPIFAVSSYDGAQKPQYRANLANGTLASPTDLSNAGHAFFSFLGSIRYEGSDRYLGGLEFWSEGTGQGGEFGPSNYHSSFRIQTAARGATSRTVSLKMNGHQLELPSYGVGSYTGTVSRGLAVTTDGVVIETAKESQHNGIFDVQNEGFTRAVVEMYVTDSLTYIRNDQTTGGNTLGFRMHKGSQPNWVTNSFSALGTRGTEASPAALNSNDQMFAINCSAQVDGSTSVNVMQYVWRTGPNWNATTNRQTSLLIQGVENGQTARTDIFELEGSDLILHKYTGGAKDATPDKALGVDSAGKVVTYAPAAQIAQGSRMTITDTDFELPPIDVIGQPHIVVNPSGNGSAVYVTAHAGDTILTTNNNVTNGHSALYVAVTSTQWARVS